MKFIVKPHPEIYIKSESVRKRFIKILDSNIRNIVKHRTSEVAVFNCRDHIEVTAKTSAYYDQVLEILTNTPGIAHVLEVMQSEFSSLHDIYEQVLALNSKLIVDKTFAVRVKRTGKHDFSSIDAERYIGGGLNQAVASAKVKLQNPQVTIKIEIINNVLNQILARYKGLGGFPLGTQEDVLSLISGGYDSGVSSYLHIKRGSKVHYCFFNLGGDEHEAGVKRIAYHLWYKYGSSAKVRFISLDFAPVVSEILERVADGQMGVVLKRMFMRAASMIADKFNIQALVTGEALGQVSSQTLTNLRQIDNVVETLILRPLITWDKEDIIKLSKEIGIEEIARTIPEYCGVISKSPTVKAVKKELEKEEENFNFSLLEQVVYNATISDIREFIPKPEHIVVDIEQISNLDTFKKDAQALVLDIRSPEEEESSPLQLDGIEIVHMPFYKLASNFDKLDQNKTYLLYCDRGVMSRMQAIYLQDQGFKNVKVYRP